MEMKTIEIIVKNTTNTKIVDFQVTCNNSYGVVIFVLTEDGSLLRIEVTNGYWRPGYGWADRPTWVDGKVTVSEV